MSQRQLLGRILPSKISQLFAGSDEPQRTDRRYRNKNDQRSPFQRDRDRILYTEHFNRLAGVTQVARTGESYLYHNRQSHTLKVAQIGQRLAEYLVEATDDEKLNTNPGPNPDIVETAALAHDLGHPPFGHTVEKELDQCVQDEGVDEGFEANAQSFRTVTKLSTHRDEYDGLDLTRASLNAILKYPWARGEHSDKPNKWGYFESEQEDFEFARELTAGMNRSIEAQIMDWADDVAYAVHDLEDFYKAGLIPLDQILVDSGERDNFITHVKKNTKIDASEATAFFDNMGAFAFDILKKPYTGRPNQKAALNILTSELINRYLGFPGSGKQAVRLTDTGSQFDLKPHPALEKEVDVLIELTRYYIINDSSLMAQQHGQRKVMRELFNHLMKQALPDASYRGLVPSPYKDELKKLDELGTKRERVRIVTDLLCRLTEQQALLLYERLEGTSPGSLQDRIIR